MKDIGLAIREHPFLVFILLTMLIPFLFNKDDSCKSVSRVETATHICYVINEEQECFLKTALEE